VLGAFRADDGIKQVKIHATFSIMHAIQAIHCAIVTHICDNRPCDGA
jgi:hypothetical protein